MSLTAASAMSVIDLAELHRAGCTTTPLAIDEGNRRADRDRSPFIQEWSEYPRPDSSDELLVITRQAGWPQHRHTKHLAVWIHAIVKCPKDALNTRVVYAVLVDVIGCDAALTRDGFQRRRRHVENLGRFTGERQRKHFWWRVVLRMRHADHRANGGGLRTE